MITFFYLDMLTKDWERAKLRATAHCLPSTQVNLLKFHEHYTHSTGSWTGQYGPRPLHEFVDNLYTVFISDWKPYLERFHHELRINKEDATDSKLPLLELFYQVLHNRQVSVQLNLT